ncbi:MAG TPA: DUF1295 domain-containing protein [Candidatus Saccharimonadales bacterium]|nr:DUF1295 domain-containing protein [Candidatus Saccharimonadales bacterium]
MSLGLVFGISLAAVIAYMGIWFGFASYVKRLDVVDTAWGLGFVYLALIIFYGQAGHTGVQLLALWLVTLWGLRLATHITLRNINRSEDERYAALRRKWGKHVANKAFINIYLLQALLILLVSAPVLAIESTLRSGWTPLVKIGFVVWLLGLVVESLADFQLRRFLKSKHGGVMQSGLWRYSRHPNYFGEIITWIGAGLVACGLDRWWGLVGPAVITFLIVKVSGLPPLEKHFAKDKAYQDYAQKTSVLIPWFKKS